jgi:hypothetical protein
MSVTYRSPGILTCCCMHDPDACDEMYDFGATVHGNRITAELNLLLLRICCVIILLEF